MTSAQVEFVLTRIRPAIQADGGDIQLVRVDGGAADVRMTGRCVDCPSLHMTLYLGIEQALRQAIPGFVEVRLIP